jgi:hypothetical protein
MQHAELQAVTEINRWLLAGVSVAQFALIARLFQERLARLYPVFTMYLVIDLAMDGVLALVADRTIQFVRLYRASLIIATILEMGVVWELYNRICDHFPGIGAFRLRVAGSAILMGAAVSFISIPSVAAHWGYPVQAAFLAMKQYETEASALLLIAIWLFFGLLRVRPQYRRNLVIHWRIVTLYFLVSCAHALAILWTGLGENVHPINTAMLLADLILMLAWAALLNRRGEELPELPRLSPAELQALEQRDSELTGFITQMPRQIASRLK